MKQLNQDLYTYDSKDQDNVNASKRHLDLLYLLEEVGIVENFKPTHKDEQMTFKIKSSQKFSKSLHSQLIQWKAEKNLSQKTNIYENYLNSTVIKDTLIHKSNLQVGKDNISKNNEYS